MPEFLPTPTKTPRSVKTVIELSGQHITIYAGMSVREAFQIVSKDMNLYSGVRLTQLMEAIYEQGKKDGRRHAVETFHAASETLSYRNPGQPKKRKKLKKKK